MIDDEPLTLRLDALVRNLHKYEDIRYPERIVQQGMASSFQFGSGSPPQASGKASRDVPTFHLAVREVDALVKAICVACSINPKAYTVCFQPPGSTCLRRDNAEDLF